MVLQRDRKGPLKLAEGPKRPSPSVTCRYLVPLAIEPSEGDPCPPHRTPLLLLHRSNDFLRPSAGFRGPFRSL